MSQLVIPADGQLSFDDLLQRIHPELVVEVGYDHFTNGRFRHGTRFIRWRPDKAPRQCTMDQVEIGERPGVFS